MRYRLNDGAIGTMIPDDQVPECWGGTNPDADGDLWLQVDGEKSARVVQPDQCSVIGDGRKQHPGPMCDLAWELRTAGYTVYEPGEVPPPFGGVPLQSIVDQLRAAKYTVLSPTDTVARARSLMAGLETASDATIVGDSDWLNGEYDEWAVKAYTYLLAWARSIGTPPQVMDRTEAPRL